MKRSKHSLSHYKLATVNMGPLVPVGLVEVLPGDTFQHSVSALIRLQPLATPVMHPVHAELRSFFIPHRLVWEDWEDFITGGPDGNDDSVFPTITFSGGTGAAVGSLADHLGIPPLVNNIEVSALPFRAYNLVVNEYYRDQDLVAERVIDLTSGPDTTTDRTLFSAAWQKDYLTSSRPWEQKGPAISIPLTGDANVVGVQTGNGALLRLATNGNLTPQRALQSSATGNFELGSGAEDIRLDPNGTLEADLSGVTAVDMNDLRLAMGLQRYEEARARYGSRYVEYMRYLGVRSSDARLQRPEYLGGTKTTVQFSEVLATAETEDTPVGSLKGHGITVPKTPRYRRFFEEHGYVMTFLVIRPITIYADGIPRTMNRRTKEDFWQKELEHIGQQAVLKKEVYAQGTSADLETFSYQDRYDEYRRQENYISGEMRTLLDSWNMARMFESMPALNSTFVTCTPTDRIFASSATDEVIVMVRHSIQARRLIAQTGTSFIY